MSQRLHITPPKKCYVGWVVVCMVWFMVGSVQAEIRETELDWEPACEGSSIKVTSQDGKLLLVEASAWHFTEARDWICVFKDGTLLTATYRQCTLTRKPKGDDGAFEVISTVDRVETFQAKDGIIQNVPTDRKSDVETVLSKARASLTEPTKKK
ncbi:MAG: hypothetical protein HS117_17865 [Verrucomicrobiaceae bacterium]|nr:hypothetical protein [Verrucomicrobiaceae bacterium]